MIRQGSNVVDVSQGGTRAERANFAGIETSIDLDGVAASIRLRVDGEDLIADGADGVGRQRWRHWRYRGASRSAIGRVVFLAGTDRGPLGGSVAPSRGADASITQFIEQFDGHRASSNGSPVTPSAGVTERGSPTAPHWQIAAQLGGLMRPFLPHVALLMTLSLVAVAVELVPPMLLGALIDRVWRRCGGLDAASDIARLASGNRRAGCSPCGLPPRSLAFGKGYVSSRVGTAMTADLRDRLVEKLNELPLAFHDRNQVGRLMSQVAYDTETLHTLVYHMTSGLLMQLLQLVGIGVMLVLFGSRAGGRSLCCRCR